MRLFTPNHVALIEACYPASSTLSSGGPDVGPKGQETSRLVYYASNQAGKLQKLGTELERRATIETNRASNGNARYRASLLITLALFKALATECRQELSLLTPYLMRTLSMAFLRLQSDLEVIAKAASVLTTWCTYTDGSLIGTDDAVTKAYFQCLEHCRKFSVVTLEVAKDGEKRNRMRLIGMAVLTSVVESEVLYRSPAEFQAQASITMSALLQNMIEVDLNSLTSEALITRSQTLPSSPYMSEFRPGPLAERRAASIHVHVDGDTGPSDIDVVNAALRILSALLQRSKANQVSQCLRGALDFFEEKKLWNNADFCTWFIHTSTEWTQYQYRYTVPNRIVQTISAMHDVDPISHSTLLMMLHAVLTSQTPLINLSTSDIAAQLITFLLRTTAYDPSNSVLEQIPPCISATATHIYYADQIQDLTHELLSKLANVQVYGPLGPNRPSSEESRIKTLILLLSALHGLMQMAEHHAVVSRPEGMSLNQATPASPTLDRNIVSTALESDTRNMRRTRIDPEAWQDSLALLCEVDPSVRSTYTSQLIHFISSEVDGDVIPEARTTPSRPSLVTVDSVLRFLHALHASVFSLLTSSSLGLAPIGSSGTESVHGIDSPNRANGEEGTLSDESTETPLSPPGHKKRQQSVNLSLMDKPKFPEDVDEANEINVASPKDYQLVWQILSTVHGHLPVRGLLSGVPMLLALDNAARAIAQRESSFKRTRATILFEVLLRTWKAIGTAWDCKELVLEADKLLDRFYEHSTLLEGSTIPLPLETFPDLSNPILPYESITGWLSSSVQVQAATGLDRATVLRSLTRSWSVELALKESVERFSTQETHTQSGPPPLIKLSPQLMHIENLSLSSLARSVRGVGAGDLREALEGKDEMSLGRHADPSSSTPNNFHASIPLALKRTRSRGAQSRNLPRLTSASPSEIKDIFSKLGIGKEGSDSLLKASFPSLKTSNGA